MNHRKQKIYIHSEKEIHAQEASCLETGLFEILRVQYSREVGKCVYRLYLLVYFVHRIAGEVFISGTVSITIPNESGYNMKSAKKKVDL